MFRFLRLRRSVLALSTLGAAGLVACSATNENNASGFTGGDGGHSSGHAAGGAGGGHFDPVGGGNQGNGVGCTADLQGVVDAQGNTSPCPPDKGCSGGQCVPACDAAAGSRGSIGCEFLAPDPPFYLNGSGSTYDGTCYAMFIANTWGRAAKITVSRGGQSFDVTQFGRIPNGIIPNVTYDPIPAEGLPPNQVAVLFLSHKPGAVHGLGTPLTCPVPPALIQDAAVSGSGRGTAFSVISDTPVTSYDILPYGGAQSYLPSASLLFPTTSWGTNYYAVAPHAEGGGLLWMMAVGTQDNTDITIAPFVTLPGGADLGPANGGQATPFTINKGEILQWIGADPTGAVLQSSAPIGVFTGSTYLRVATNTSSGGGQDSAHQQIPHIQALGSEYVGPGVMTRMPDGTSPESVSYRLLGVKDGTQLTYDPAAPPTAPTTLAAGQAVEFLASQFFVVRSQDDDHPFAMTQYLSGTILSGTRPGCDPTNPSFGGGTCLLGDEEWVTLLAPKQFLQEYVFFTDPTYATTNLVLTRVKGKNGFESVNVECLGEVTSWQPVGSGGTYEVAHVDLVRGGSPVAGCTSSRHAASSAGRFGVMVWGTDWFSSYGYPAGGNAGSINNVVIPPDPK
jgi:hypothetical protein